MGTVLYPRQTHLYFWRPLEALSVDFNLLLGSFCLSRRSAWTGHTVTSCLLSLSYGEQALSIQIPLLALPQRQLTSKISRGNHPHVTPK